MDKRVRDMMGGGLRPNDPRRFLIEAMIGAMFADGNVDKRELEVLHRQLNEHDLFAGLGADAAKTLIELASDAVQFAGSATGRVGAIAKGLPARVHRLTAYAMACEVCAADEDIAPLELQFLEALRIAVRVSPFDGQQVFAAAREKKVTRFLEDRVLRIRSLFPVVVEAFTLRAHSLGLVTDDHRFALRDFLSAIPDFGLRQDEIERELYLAFRKQRPAGFNVFNELGRISFELPDPVDRYWLVVYAMLVEPHGRAASWRVIPFVSLLQQAFQIGDADMELAAADASAFPANLPRP
jgi:hypothetical protein